MNEQDMESWAKSMNKKKDVKKSATPLPITINTSKTTQLAPAPPQTVVSGFVEIKPQAFTSIEKPESSHVEPPIPTSSPEPSSLSASNEQPKTSSVDTIAINLKVFALKCVSQRGIICF